MWSKLLGAFRRGARPDAASPPTADSAAAPVDASRPAIGAAIDEAIDEAIGAAIAPSELGDGFYTSHSVVVVDAPQLTHVGRCQIGGRLVLRRCRRLTSLSADLVTHGLVLDGATALQQLPAGLRVDGNLRLIGCTQLEALPEELEVTGSLVIRGCPRLRALPRQLRVGKDLYLVGKTRLAALPATLTVGGDIVLQRSVRQLEPGFAAPASLALIGCDQLEELPADLSVGGDLIVRRCPKLARLRPGLSIAGSLEADGAAFASLPAGLRVGDDLVITGCNELVELPAGLSVGGDLILRDCPKLSRLQRGLSVAGKLEARRAAFASLPADLRVGGDLDLEGCAQLTSLPDHLVVPGRLRLQRCVQLARLPAGLTIGRPGPACSGVWSSPLPADWKPIDAAQLNLMDCPQIAALPEDLKIHSSIEIAGTALTGLPPALAGVPLAWRGVLVPARAVFHPESFGAKELLALRNVEVRRIVMERLGPERVVELLQPTTIDEDTDPGGPRRLLSVAGSGKEPLVFLDCRCPSTGRRYLLRTAPHVQTCHAAAAWLAGFDNPDSYRPIVET